MINNLNQIIVYCKFWKIIFNVSNKLRYKVPHMGWNKIKTKKNNTVLDHFNNERFYFVHSYYLPSTNALSFSSTVYGCEFISSIANQTQLLTQFHPEKSGEVGLALLDQFLKQLP